MITSSLPTLNLSFTLSVHSFIARPLRWIEVYGRWGRMRGAYSKQKYCVDWVLLRLVFTIVEVGIGVGSSLWLNRSQKRTCVRIKTIRIFLLSSYSDYDYDPHDLWKLDYQVIQAGLALPLCAIGFNMGERFCGNSLSSL